MRKNGKLAQTYTEDGLVKIRIKNGKGEPLHTIRDTIMLESIVSKYSQPSDENAQLVPDTTKNPSTESSAPNIAANITPSDNNNTTTAANSTVIAEPDNSNALQQANAVGNETAATNNNGVLPMDT